MSSTRSLLESPTPQRPPHSSSPPPRADTPADQHESLDNPHEEDDYPYPEPTSDAPLLPPANFNPFFTIIEDSTTGEHHHSYIHYVFADDDPAIVTAAAMRSLGLDDTAYLPQTAEEHHEQEQEQEHEDAPVESPLPPPLPGVEERYLIVDVAADGQTVLDAQSLSSEWQVSNAGTRTAPSFDSEPEDQRFMLKIDGVTIPKRNKGKGKDALGETKFKEARDKTGGDPFKAMDGIVKGVEESVDVARRIGGAGKGESTIRVEKEEDSTTEA